MKKPDLASKIAAGVVILCIAAIIVTGTVKLIMWIWGL